MLLVYISGTIGESAVDSTEGKPLSVEDIIEDMRPSEGTATICTAGDLVAEWEIAEAALKRLDDKGRQKLSDGGERHRAAERVADLERQMRGREVTFRFRAMPWRAFQKLKDSCAKADAEIDMERMVPALILACAVSPKFSDAAQLDRLLDRLSQSQVDLLFSTAWGLNTRRADIPKSVRASALMASTEQR